MCLSGGDRARGQQLFAFSETAQCLRCHQLKGFGGEVGPDLTTIGSTLDREGMLLSLVDPSARIAPGYGAVSLKLKSGDEVAGIIIEETSESIFLANSPVEEPTSYPIEDIAERKEFPSGMLDMSLLLEKSELRDLVEFLVTLQ